MLQLTALVITLNEQENIARSLAPLSWVDQVLIVDSGSNDRTLEIGRAAHPNVSVLVRQFDSFAGQCNFGLDHITTEWVLSIDADYVLTPELMSEVKALAPADDVGGYAAHFNYCVHGYRLRNTVYPARTVLYRRRLAQYFDEGHGHRVRVEGRVLPLLGKIDHDDRKPLSHWIRSQDRYSRVEAKHLLEMQKEEGGTNKQLNLQDRLRLKIYCAPVVMFFYLLFGRGLILDGWRGWYYVLQRTIAEMLLSLRLLTEREKLETEQETEV